MDSYDGHITEQCPQTADATGWGHCCYALEEILNWPVDQMPLD
jgi:hypothetical protein